MNNIDIAQIQQGCIIDTNFKGKKTQYILFENMEKLNCVLSISGLKTISKEDPWRFNTTLPQTVRDEMIKNSMFFALNLNSRNGMVYFYNPQKSCMAIPLKYLKFFTKENVKININGKTYSYFMTNDINALKDKLWSLGYLFPKQDEWTSNQILHKKVLDKMSDLGAIYSITLNHNCTFMNKYADDIPYTIDLKEYKNKQQNQITEGILQDIIKKDDKNSLEKYLKNKKNVDSIKISGFSLLMIASSYNSYSCADLLIKTGADINATNEKGITALMIASGHGAKDVVKTLLRANADKTIRANNGWTSYIYALAYGFEDIAKLLSDNEGAEEKDSIWKEEKLSFHDRLSLYISRFISYGNKKPSEIYKNLKGFMSKQTFSRIQSTVSHPKKTNIFLLAIGMQLSLSDTEKLLSSAGYILSNKDKVDIIIKDCIKNKCYDIININLKIYEKTGKEFFSKPNNLD